jgi:hypothetical protein
MVRVGFKIESARLYPFFTTANEVLRMVIYYECHVEK